MKFFSTYFPQVNTQIWILALGRFLSAIGTGFTLFYAPIFFVKGVGLSSTDVGLALGSGSISGIIGRILGGSLSDSPKWGRRRTLLFSIAISAIACLFLAMTYNLPTLFIGNLLSGFGVGLYWPATETIVADLTTGNHRQEAYALTRMADNLGLGLGIVLGGIIITTTGNYQLLFIIDSISFAVFFAVIYFAITETKPKLIHLELSNHQKEEINNKIPQNKWLISLGDRRLLIYIVVNIIFTTYISQTQSTIPLYFSKFINSGQGFSEIIITGLFTWNMLLSILCLIPINRFLRRYTHPQILMISGIMWALGFIGIWGTSLSELYSLFFAILGMGILAIATIAYTPSASALVADMAPLSLRGVYLAINSLCWAIGYFIGPPLGGWALDQNPIIANSYWLFLAISVVMVIGILLYLDRLLKKSIYLSKN